MVIRRPHLPRIVCITIANMSNCDSNQRHRVVFLDLPRSPVSTFGASQGATGETTEKRELCSVPELSYRLGTGCTVTATFSSHACRALRNRCAGSNLHGREVGGILIGYSRQTTRVFHRRYEVMVTDVIPIESRDSSSSHISFGHAAWTSVQREISRTYFPEGKCRLGWYHTHPAQGIFFSEQDREGHALFKQPFELALVVDPKSMEAGLYYWRNYGDKTLAGPLRFAVPV
jgi:proteasome lid subunit RPN8/RPN11